jgi:hypothetical protein
MILSKIGKIAATNKGQNHLGNPIWRMCHRYSKICQNQANATIKPKFQTPLKKAASLTLAAPHHHFKIVKKK